MNEKTINRTMSRDSNVELLRICAMFFIICHHFIHNSLYSFSAGAAEGLTAEYGVYSLLDGLFYVGVNCFLLISGYYGIKLRARKIWSMYLQLAFYGAGCYLAESLMLHKPITYTLITKSVFIFSHPCWWFVVNFLLLMFLSPWINQGIKQMTKKQYLLALIGLTFVQVYLGWFWQKERYDVDGYSLLNFVYIYVIGGYIGRFVSKESIEKRRWSMLCTYVACAILWGICNVLRLYIQMPFGRIYGYNNPIVICGAISLFLFFLSWQFKNKYVNWLAGGAFAAYLITDTQYVGYHLYFTYDKFIHSLNLHLWQVIGITLIVAAIIVLLCCCIDKLRAYIMKPLLPAFDWLDRKLGIIENE